MKIKNVRQFRSIIKKDIAGLDYNDRNENFIGVNVVKDGVDFEYGFFSIYHGLKKGYKGNDGVRGFLKGFLDMASDGQAVYEFMQNAVDAVSSKFCLFWDKDENGEEYLLVVNNGNMFDADGIQSILNIGISTKASESYSIGKFGIGFKLAHRLVGKENGLDELINDNYGPILFSWKNSDLKSLALLSENDDINPTDFQYDIVVEGNEKRLSINSEEPWLFKILITNFPCQPENNSVPEEIEDYKYTRRTDAFSKKELSTLVTWVNKYSSYFSEGFDKGSLFFIKLGQGKKTHLEAANLEEGVRFSLAILNRIAFKSLGHDGLKDVILKGVHLKPVELEFEPFIIERGTDDFRNIRFGKTTDLTEFEIATEKTDADIEILIGYTDYKYSFEAFRYAPNFYLFFPLSEEKHNLRFIIHSNAFYKGTARTHLQKGNSKEDGINERLLFVFTRLLSMRLLEWANSTSKTNRDNFLSLYSNLLLSNKSDNPERIWVNEPLWNPILQFLENHIPVKEFATNSFTLASQPLNVKIKSTVLPVDTENWLDGKVNWFIWDNTEIELSTEAEFKLKLGRFNIVDLLQYKGISIKLNSWLASSNYAIVPILLHELNTSSFTSVKQLEIFWTNLGTLKIWEFDDGYFSLEEIGNEAEYSNRLILFDTLDSLKEQLSKGGWKLSKHSLAEYINLFPSIQNRFQSIVKYIRRNEELIKVLNLNLPAAELSRLEKLNILKILAKKLADDKEERITKLRELKIFRNTIGDYMPLKSLLKSTSIIWLGSWVIHSDDYDPALDEYLISNPVDIYKNIVLQYWKSIVNRITLDTEIRSLFDYAKGVHKQNIDLNTLSGYEIVRIGKTFVLSSSTFYYSSSLASFSESEYLILESALSKLNVPPIPNYDLLKYYDEAPFKIANKKFSYSMARATSLSLEEAKYFLKLCAKDFPDVYQSLDIYQNHENEIIASPKKENVHLVASDNNLVRNYISNYHSDLFVILPLELMEFSNSIVLQGTPLIKRLAHHCDYDSNLQLKLLIEVALQSGIDSRKILVDKITKVQFELDKDISSDLASVQFISLLKSINDDTITTQNIKSKVSINFESELFKLSEVHLFGNDEVSFERGEKKFTLSLSSILLNTDSKATKIVGQLTEELSKVGIADKQILDKMFGLTGQVEKAFIADIVKNKYTEKVLENSHQLAFVLLYALLKPKDFLITQFQVATKSGQLSLNNIFLYAAENTQQFIPESLSLNNNYTGLSAILSDDINIFKFTQGVSICFQPYFENNKFILPGIAKLDSNQKRLALIEFIFNCWKESKELLKNIDLGENKKWIDLIGFEPTCSISGSNLILESEKIPDFVQIWLDNINPENNSKEKYDFLRSLGISLSGADIIKIRKYLTKEENDEPNVNYLLPPSLIINTLILLANRKCIFKFIDLRLQLLKNLFHRLPDNVSLFEIPVPLISSNTDDSFFLGFVKEGLSIELTTIEQLRAIEYSIRNLQTDSGSAFVFSGLHRSPSKLKELFPTANFKFDNVDPEKIANNGVPWERNFYNEWKTLYPTYEIITYPGLMPNQLQIGGKSIFHYPKGDIAHLNNQIIVNGELNEKRIISLIEAKKLIEQIALNKLKELFNKYDVSIQDLLNRIQSNRKLREEWEKLQQKEREVQKKKELNENFGKSERYSMGWFMNLLELMVMSGGGKDIANPDGDIYFNKVDYDENDLRVISFGDPSKTIPPSIELFTNFKAIFNYWDYDQNKKSIEIEIKGLSKKGHYVLALPVNPDKLKPINFGGIINVELRFVRIIDLIKKLTNAFRQLNFIDTFNFKRELTDNIRFIFGPPGTGKTTIISKLIIDKIESKEYKNILVLTPTNKAADVIVKRILEQTHENAYPENWLVRFGASTDLELINNGYVYDSSTLKLHLHNQCVLVTTIHRFPYEQIITNDGVLGEEKTRLSEIAWDCIIFDEASMIMLPAIVYPLFKRKFKRHDELELTEFIIGGDPLQIPPIFDLPDEELPKDQRDVKEENIYSMVGLKSFKKEDQLSMERFGNKIDNLTTQYRSIEAIGKLFSRFQYHDKLDHGRKYSKGGTPAPRPLPEYFQKLGFKPITVIRYPVNTSDTIFDPQKLNGSPFQLYSTFLVNELVLKFREHVINEWTLGVIAPYRSQATLLNKLIDNHADKSKINVVTDTVHGFQGDQCDMIFAVFNPSSARSQFSFFLQKEYIINVAISRARDYLFILLPDKETEGFDALDLIHENFDGSLLKIIGDLPEEMVAILDAKELEEKVLIQKDYFLKNSFTNVHQDVNIYSDLIKNYTVRVSGKAVDMHVRKQ